MRPDKVYFEDGVMGFDLGRELYAKFKEAEWIRIENHNNIPELRNNENCEFGRMKRHIVLGVRKTHKYVQNSKTSDFLVPYTSSGCSAMCLYCYLVCNYNKCSYLRLFVNREQMLEKLLQASRKSQEELTFEIGSNSDLVLENELTGNLEWTIERFGKAEKGFITLPTKFDMVQALLPLVHRGRTIIRMSVNPPEVIKRVEFGTSGLMERIKALNSLDDAGYKVGVLVAPIVLVDNWKIHYKQLFEMLSDTITASAKSHIFFEVIFMTYSYIHRMINNEAFPNAIELYDKDLMTGRGKGRYCYKPEARNEAEELIKSGLVKNFPDNRIEYIV